MALIPTLLVLLYGAIFTECMFSHGSYKAAVIEYSTLLADGQYTSSEELLKTNSEEYVKYIEEASLRGAQIIVFPENGLTSPIIFSKPADIFIKYSIEVPDLHFKPNPCDNESLHKTLRLIACAARDQNIYVVFNLVERQSSDGRYTFYSTDLVIDRGGTIIAKYRKINVLTEPHIRRGHEVVTFTTDFGVTFGLMNSYDIMFKRPALEVIREKNVTDIIYPTTWTSETPFMQSLSVQAGYARATGVNLLASSLNDPVNKHGGSGIYLYNGKIAEFYISPANSKKLLVQEVPKINIKISAVKCNNNSQIMPGFRLGGNLNAGHFTTVSQNMENALMQTVTHERPNATLCSLDGVYCCYFHALLEKPLAATDPKYRFSLTYEIRSLGNTTIGVRSCGIVACINNEKKSCGKYLGTTRTQATFTKLVIVGKFQRSSKTFDQPITLTYDLIPVTEYTYCETVSDDKRSVLAEMISTQPLTNLLSFGIHGRLYEYDWRAIGNIINGASEKSVNYLLVLVVVPFLRELFYFS